MTRVIYESSFHIRDASDTRKYLQQKCNIEYSWLELYIMALVAYMTRVVHENQRHKQRHTDTQTHKHRHKHRHKHTYTHIHTRRGRLNRGMGEGSFYFILLTLVRAWPLLHASNLYSLPIHEWHRATCISFAQGQPLNVFSGCPRKHGKLKRARDKAPSKRTASEWLNSS